VDFVVKLPSSKSLNTRRCYIQTTFLKVVVWLVNFYRRDVNAVAALYCIQGEVGPKTHNKIGWERSQQNVYPKPSNLVNISCNIFNISAENYAYVWFVSNYWHSFMHTDVTQ